MYGKDIPQDQITWNFHSFVQNYQLICDKGSLRSLFKQEIQFGAAILQLICNLLCDVYGRKTTWFIFIVLIYAIAISANFVNVIEYKIFAMLCLSAQTGINNALACLVMNESCTSKSKLRSYAIGILFMFFAFGGVMMSLFTFVIKDPNHLFILTTCSPAIVSLMLPFFLKEPPKNLYNKGKINELFINLHSISKRNKKTVSIQTLQESANIYEVDIENSK